MRVALLSAFYPYRGGIAQFSAMFYRALEQRGEDVKAFTFSRQYPDILFPGSSQYVKPDDDVDKIEAERILDSVNPISFRSSAKKINSFHPDIYIGQYWMTFFGPAMGGVQKRLDKGVKRISILHNVIPHEKRFFDDYANRSFLRNNDGFIVLSDAVQRDLLSILPDAKYLRIDHPVYNQFGDALDRNEALNSLGLDVKNKYVLFFGFIRDYKGLDLLISALKKLPNDIHVIIAGEVYGSFDKYQKQIETCGLMERVHVFNQYIADEDVKSYFSASDVCVLPYKSATQSGITAISHHFNLPIIATDVGGLKETIEDMKTGLIVDPSDAQISQAIQKYFNLDLKNDFSANIARDKASNSWGNFADKVMEFAKSL